MQAVQTTLTQNHDTIQSICNKFFENSSGLPKVVFTKGHNIVIITSMTAGSNQPLLGAYYTSDSIEDGEWIPSRWHSNGSYSLNRAGLLDLVLQTPPTEAA